MKNPFELGFGQKDTGESVGLEPLPGDRPETSNPWRRCGLNLTLTRCSMNPESASFDAQACLLA